jgi:hypothetical protein
LQPRDPILVHAPDEPGGIGVVDRPEGFNSVVESLSFLEREDPWQRTPING